MKTVSALKFLPTLCLLFAANDLMAQTNACQALKSQDQNQPNRIMVIALDEKTLSPEPFGLGENIKNYRRHNVKLIERLNSAKARGAAFDFYYLEDKDRMQDTMHFADAAAKSALPIVVSMYGNLDSDGHIKLTPNSQVLRARPEIGQGTINFIQQSVVYDSQDEANKSNGAYRLVEGISGFNSLVNELAIRTGDVRKNQIYAMGMVEWDISTDGQGSITLPTVRVHMRSRPPESVCTVSYVDVIEGLHQDLLKNSLVLVGVVAPGKDEFTKPDPVELPELEKAAGVYLHAAALSRLIESSKLATIISENSNHSNNNPKTRFIPKEKYNSQLEQYLEKNLHQAILDSKSNQKMVLDFICIGLVMEEYSDCQSQAQNLISSLLRMVDLSFSLESTLKKILKEDVSFDPKDNQRLKSGFNELEGLLITDHQFSSILFPQKMGTRPQDVFVNYRHEYDGIMNIAQFLFE